MRRTFSTQQSLLYDLLLGLGVRNRCATEIENLRHHCGYSSFGVDTLEPLNMVVYSVGYDYQLTQQAIENGVSCGTTIVILSPYATPHRAKMCDKIVAQHHSTTLNRRGYLVVFNNHLPKQHFVL